MISLASTSVALRIDPRHGGEVLDLIDLRSGRQLLGRPPFASDEPQPGEHDETTWTRGYRGGWQLLVPNAGNACVLDGVTHGFHGRASTDPWDVVEQRSNAATLVWTGHDMRVERAFELGDDTVTVRSTISAERTVPLVWVEHVGLGVELLDPAVEIDLAGGLAYELDERTGPTEPPPSAPSWPEVRLLDGTIERATGPSSEAPAAECWSSRTCLTGGWSCTTATAVRESNSPGIRAGCLTSGSGTRSGRPADRGARWAETLIVEPASVPHTLGLATAQAHSQAHVLHAGQHPTVELTLRPLRDR